MASKKDIFRYMHLGEITPAEIKKNKKEIVADSNLVLRLEELGPDEYMKIARPGSPSILIDPKWLTFNLRGQDFVRMRMEKRGKFLRHGDEIKVISAGNNVSTLLNRLVPGKANSHKPIHPYTLIKEAYENAGRGFYSCYSIVPIIGSDKRIRRIPLLDCIDGTLLFAYAQKQCGGCDVMPYTDAHKVAEEGGSVVVRVPSRSPKHPRQKFRIDNLAIKEGPLQNVVGASIITTHNCDDMIYKGIRYKQADEKISSKHFNFDAHDICGILAAMEDYERQGNMTPSQCSYILVPTEFMFGLYKKMRKQCIVEDFNHKGKVIEYCLNEAELESFIQGCAIHYGLEKTFLPRHIISGDIKEYFNQWME